jgi:hypothetical protein
MRPGHRRDSAGAESTRWPGRWACRRAAAAQFGRYRRGFSVRAFVADSGWSATLSPRPPTLVSELQFEPVCSRDAHEASARPSTLPDLVLVLGLASGFADADAVARAQDGRRASAVGMSRMQRSAGDRRWELELSSQRTTERALLVARTRSSPRTDRYRMERVFTTTM